MSNLSRSGPSPLAAQLPTEFVIMSDMATVRAFVADVARAKAFYVSAFGFEAVEDWGPAMSIIQRGDLVLWLAGPSASATKPWEDGTQPAPGGHTRIVLEMDDETAQLTAVEAAGGKRLNGPISGPGGTQLIVADPDGNPIELFRAR